MNCYLIMVYISLYRDPGGTAKDVDKLNLFRINHSGGFWWVINTLKTFIDSYTKVKKFFGEIHFNTWCSLSYVKN